MNHCSLPAFHNQLLLASLLMTFVQLPHAVVVGSTVVAAPFAAVVAAKLSVVVVAVAVLFAVAAVVAAPSVVVVVADTIAADVVVVAVAIEAVAVVLAALAVAAFVIVDIEIAVNSETALAVENRMLAPVGSVTGPNSVAVLEAHTRSREAGKIAWRVRIPMRR